MNSLHHINSSRMKHAAKWLAWATIPIALYLQFFTHELVWQFILSCVAVIPVAAWIGHSTEHLAHRMGPTYGALFNATFGNSGRWFSGSSPIRRDCSASWPAPPPGSTSASWRSV